jgi:hypothetical protein
MQKVLSIHNRHLGRLWMENPFRIDVDLVGLQAGFTKSSGGSARGLVERVRHSLIISKPPM